MNRYYTLDEAISGICIYTAYLAAYTISDTIELLEMMME